MENNFRNRTAKGMLFISDLKRLRDILILFPLKVATQLVGTYDLKGMKERMTQRKLNNTKTSIHFGNEKVCLFEYCKTF